MSEPKFSDVLRAAAKGVMRRYDFSGLPAGVVFHMPSGRDAAIRTSDAFLSVAALYEAYEKGDEKEFLSCLAKSI